ncbi:transglutaminase-like cysteine peptidase [Thalassotalea aquiviva]|uniref:transglutaminase-like cysteine peptidase n=1 Tax=Thalassotalea aquiviva TaxID=3242415 RepID=UPI00352B32E3
MNRLILLICLSVSVLSGCANTNNGVNDDLNSNDNLSTLLYSPAQQTIDLNDPTAIRTLLATVNLIVNQSIRYEYDQVVYGENDYWASPMEVLNHRRGDCEDYAFLKREILINLGIPRERLKLIQGDVKEMGAFAGKKRIPHIVLAYFPTPESHNPMILDNMRTQVMLLKTRNDFRLNYVFDESNVWKSINTKDDKKVYNTDILPKFAKLRDRNKAPAFGASSYIETALAQ